MRTAENIATGIVERARGRRRIVVGLAGAPGAGKSTLSERLLAALPAGEAAQVPMDGFHFDNAVLDAMGLRHRKGAPQTFDCAGLKATLRRVRSDEGEVAVPLFDRRADLARAGAAIIPADARFVLVEGNYLLLDQAPWSELAPLFDLTIFIDVPMAELERRLLARWTDLGRSEEAARAWVEGNDLPNARLVVENSRRADIIWRNGAAAP
ncbi:MULTISPECIES: nucleoside triphosphate hydrolase [unclassified Bosea (in: a-proteobacteria)]|uniref:nucleoside triphosphate hydrolase n=1 Tax=unclassified Bosea (in: a-proteobacteria) TaxID=2653178 RepID=UPI00125F69AE|nr:MULTISPECIES: nucleoside triphosphate hydrolase [unclassified Bosea (in: a-proteobacteria)]CAD5288126.1 Nucleoside/nucleotide kinase family protein [Bosea sp. 7B]VXB64392.1 Nucleoside/nucleotide kinase family protein [Bosea sp. 125]VXC96238.1 Nucleoside/nucleotide kinase family protein [Bosea sp. 127]